MKRRRFLALLKGLGISPVARPLIGAATVSVLAACSGEPSSGPVQVKWDRDADPRCGMIISDKRFAAQIRDPQGKAWKFDDIGCAIFWLSQRAFDEDTPKVEFWVADYRMGGWIDARKAHYLPEKKSPMGYQFGAVARPEGDAVAYQEMKQRILARGK